MRVEPHEDQVDDETPATSPETTTATNTAGKSAGAGGGAPSIVGATRQINGLWRRVPAWMRRWDFALALALGATLRLLWLGDTSFLADQADLLALARSSLAHHSLLATGITSSIGVMNPPAGSALLLPFAPLSDPFWATLATAFANILAVALLYGVANRYLGRRAAFAATLLYATASGPITYSRFIWQQNLLAPILILFFWTLCLGVMDHKRGWLGWNVLLWGVAIQLHPTALPLIALTLLGVYLVHAEIRWRDWAYALGALAALFAPTLAWEIASRGYDVTAALGYGHKTSMMDATAAYYLFNLFLPTGSLPGGSATPHSVATTALNLLNTPMGLLYVAAQVWLAASVVAGVLTRRPLLGGSLSRGVLSAQAPHATRATQSAQSAQSARSAQSASKEPAVETAPAGLPATTSADADGRVADGAHDGKASETVTADDSASLFAASRAAVHTALMRPQWRFLLLLALWQALPILSMIRHSSPVQPHYLLVVLPATFLIVGAFLAWASRWVATAAPAVRMRLNPAARVVSAAAWTRRAGVALALVVLALAAAQSYGVWQQLDAIHTGAGNTAGTNYGPTLIEQRRVLQAASAAASDYHTRAVIATTNLLEEPLNYQAATEYTNVSAYVDAGCVVAPSAGSAPLVALATPPTPAADLLGQLRGARLLRMLPAPGYAAMPMYLLPANAHLPGEIAISPSSSAGGSQTAAPVAYAMDTTGSAGTQFVIRWSGAPFASDTGQPTTGAHASAAYWFGARAGGPVVANYSFFAQPFDAAGHALATPLRAQCGALAWGARTDVYSAVTLPSALAARQVARWRVWAQAAPLTVNRPMLGPLTLESGAIAFGPYVTIDQGTDIAMG